MDLITLQLILSVMTVFLLINYSLMMRRERYLRSEMDRIRKESCELHGRLCALEERQKHYRRCYTVIDGET